MYTLTNEIKLTRCTHNSIKCYKDETKLYMITKDEDGKWIVFRAKEHNDEITNDLRCWGYDRMWSRWSFKTLDDAKMQIEDDIIWGSWVDNFQKELKINYYEA